MRGKAVGNQTKGKKSGDAKKAVQNGERREANGVSKTKEEVKKVPKQPVVCMPKSGESPLQGTYASIATLCGFYVSDRMDLPFELLLFFYSVVHLLVQNYNIYRTNFLDVDYYAFTFCLVALFRRLIWKQAQAAFVQWSDALERSGGFKRRGPGNGFTGVNKPGFNKLLTFSAILVVLLCVSAYCGVVLASRYQNLKLLVIVVPVVMYFGVASRLQQDQPEKCLRLEWSDDEAGKEKVLHVVLSGGMFSSLWRGIIYAALFNAYYVGVIPVLFVSNEHLYWPPIRTRLLTVIVFLNTFLLLAVQSLSRNFLEYVAYAQTYGYWEQSTVPVPGDMQSKEVQVWRPGVAYKCGTLVRFHPGLVPTDGNDASSVKVDEKLLATAAVYKGLGHTNCCVPGDPSHAVAWLLFSLPFKTQACLTLGQLAIALLLLFVAVQSVAWCSVCVMLLFNYLFLFIALQAKRQTRANQTIHAVISRLSTC